MNSPAASPIKEWVEGNEVRTTVKESGAAVSVKESGTVREEFETV